MKSRILSLVVVVAFLLTVSIGPAFAQDTTQAKPGKKAKVEKKEHVMKHEKVEKKAEKIFKEWKRAFDRESPQGVINFIETEFLPVEKKFLDGEI